MQLTLRWLIALSSLAVLILPEAAFASFKIDGALTVSFIFLGTLPFSIIALVLNLKFRKKWPMFFSRRVEVLTILIPKICGGFVALLFLASPILVIKSDLVFPALGAFAFTSVLGCIYIAFQVGMYELVDDARDDNIERNRHLSTVFVIVVGTGLVIFLL